MEKTTPRMKPINPTIGESFLKIFNDSYLAVQKAIKQRQEEQERNSYWFKNQRLGSTYTPQVA
jgi:hypothetical protein